ncbi:helix-turn-helix domain-containing protein [Pseudomonas duriflava]
MTRPAYQCHFYPRSEQAELPARAFGCLRLVYSEAFCKEQQQSGNTY